MPTDLDLAVPVRKRREDDRAHTNAARAIDYSPPAKARVCSKLGEVPLDAFNRLLAVQHGRSREPANDLGPSVDVDEVIKLIQPPRADEETVRRDHSRAIAAFNHIVILALTNVGHPDRRPGPHPDFCSDLRAGAVAARQ
jgi:hypothetical protein